MVTNLDDGDYFLAEGAGWFEYNGLAVRIWSNDKLDALEVSIFRTGHEDEDPLDHTTIPYAES